MSQLFFQKKAALLLLGLGAPTAPHCVGGLNLKPADEAGKQIKRPVSFLQKILRMRHQAQSDSVSTEWTGGKQTENGKDSFLQLSCMPLCRLFFPQRFAAQLARNFHKAFKQATDGVPQAAREVRIKQQPRVDKTFCAKKQITPVIGLPSAHISFSDDTLKEIASVIVNELDLFEGLLLDYDMSFPLTKFPELTQELTASKFFNGDPEKVDALTSKLDGPVVKVRLTGKKEVGYGTQFHIDHIEKPGTTRLVYCLYGMRTRFIADNEEGKRWLQQESPDQILLTEVFPLEAGYFVGVLDKSTIHAIPEVKDIVAVGAKIPKTHSWIKGPDANNSLVGGVWRVTLLIDNLPFPLVQ